MPRLLLTSLLALVLVGCDLPPSTGGVPNVSEGFQRGPDSPDADSDGSNA